MPALENGVLVEKPRISSIDLMRGIVMVIMALDHSRDFFHTDVLQYDPTNLERTNPFLFFTRWITHFCAPTFVFLSGTSIFISSQRKTKKEMSIFLLTRGLWLIILEHTVCRLGIIYNFSYDVLIFQVIWAIGASMTIMAALIHLPARAIVMGGLLIVFGHNLLDPIQLKVEDGALFVIWSLIHQPGFFTMGTSFLVIYPVLPWLGIMMSGFGLGMLYAKDFDPDQRKRILLRIGIVAVSIFIIVRAINMYGDPAPWGFQKNFVFTLMSFINTTKYPPSLLYTLMTIGPVLIILSVMERVNIGALSPFLVFGRVPLFYYILHFYTLHAGAVVVHMIMNDVSFSELNFAFNGEFGIPLEGRHPLIVAYIAWIAVVLLLYPLCRWYNRYKSSHSHWWLSYL
jgi:uncharacterized membrane protein